MTSTTSYGTKRFHYCVVAICSFSFLPFRLHIAFLTGSNKFFNLKGSNKCFDLYTDFARGEYIQSFHQEVSLSSDYHRCQTIIMSSYHRCQAVIVVKLSSCQAIIVVKLSSLSSNHCQLLLLPVTKPTRYNIIISELYQFIIV